MTLSQRIYSPVWQSYTSLYGEPLLGVRKQPSVLGTLFRFISLFRIRRQVPDGQSEPPGVNTTVGFPSNGWVNSRW